MMTEISSTVETLHARGPSRPAWLAQRIQSEFIEMPGLSLTLPQAARLWGLTRSQAESVLRDLVEGGFLVRTPRGSYRRSGCPRCS
jgi:Fic family protein